MAKTPSALVNEEPRDRVLGKATWLGEGEDGPKTNEWMGITFKVGESVEVTSPHMMKKALNNRFYKAVENEPKAKVEAE